MHNKKKQKLARIYLYFAVRERMIICVNFKIGEGVIKMPSNHQTLAVNFSSLANSKCPPF
jgi:hypothetical protein